MELYFTCVLRLISGYVRHWNSCGTGSCMGIVPPWDSLNRFNLLIFMLLL
nr:MAG TPA: hypothetical protein [Caudoviricetes sp.]